MSILSAEDISKSYKLRKVVKGLSLEIKSGEVVGLLGGGTRIEGPGVVGERGVYVQIAEESAPLGRVVATANLRCGRRLRWRCVRGRIGAPAAGPECEQDEPTRETQCQPHVSLRAAWSHRRARDGDFAIRLEADEQAVRDFYTR